MQQSSGAIYEIRWLELCPWLILVRALRVSLFLRVLVIAWVGVLVTQGGWSFIESAFSEPADLRRIAVGSTSSEDLPASLVAVPSSSGDRIYRPATPTDMTGGEGEALRWLTHHIYSHKLGPMIEAWNWLSTPWLGMFQQDSSLMAAWQLFLCGVWAVCVWALAGGIIARIAALYLTRGEVLHPLLGFKFAATQWTSTVGAPLIGLLFAGLLAFPLALMGILARFDFFALIAGLLWGLYLLWGIMLAVVLVALWFGWPLAGAAIGVERSDSFDAASRAAAYVYQRPVHLAFYVTVASLLGILGHLAVTGFATAGEELTEWAVSWGASSKRVVSMTVQPFAEDDRVVSSGTFITAAKAVHFWKCILASIAASYPLALLWTASVGIYLLLRYHIDATELDEISSDPDLQTGMSLASKPEEPADLTTRRDVSES